MGQKGDSGGDGVMGGRHSGDGVKTVRMMGQEGRVRVVMGSSK